MKIIISFISNFHVNFSFLSSLQNLFLKFIDQRYTLSVTHSINEEKRRKEENKLFKSSFFMQIESNKQLILPGDIDTSLPIICLLTFQNPFTTQKKEILTQQNALGKGQFKREKNKDYRYKIRKINFVYMYAHTYK